MVHLNNIWFVIIAIFWVGFFILEGFDFGVGMLHSFVGTERRRASHRRQLHRAHLGRQRDVAGRGGGGDLRRLPVVVRHHVLHPLPGHGDRPSGPDRARGLLRVQPQDRQPAVAVDLEVVAHHRAALLIPFLLGTALGDLLHGLPINSVPQLHRQLLGPAGSLRALHRSHPDRALPCSLGAAYLTPQDRRARCTIGWPVCRADSAGWPP